MSVVTNSNQNSGDEDHKQDDSLDTDYDSASSGGSSEVKRGWFMATMAFILQTDRAPVFHPKYRCVLMLYASKKTGIYVKYIMDTKVASDPVWSPSALLDPPGGSWAD